MAQDIFFTSQAHQERLLAAILQIGKVYGSELDTEYATALYLLTADAGTWNKARAYVDRNGIEIEELLAEGYLSGGEGVLVRLAGNLFNNQQHLDPLEFLRLDAQNFHLALTALMIRRTGLRFEDFDIPIAQTLKRKARTI